LAIFSPVDKFLERSTLRVLLNLVNGEQFGLEARA